VRGRDHGRGKAAITVLGRMVLEAERVEADHGGGFSLRKVEEREPVCGHARHGAWASDLT
jgi:hypothetical protein